MTRLPYPDPAYIAQVMRELPARLQSTNIGRIVSHAPGLVQPYYALSAALLDGLQLDEKLRELVILRVAHQTGACYAWRQHIALARLVGAGDARIAAVQEPVPGREAFSVEEAVALQVADSLVKSPRLPDTLFAQLEARFSPREIIELLLLVGWYRAVGMLMATLEIDPETDPAALAEESVAMLRERTDRT